MKKFLVLIGMFAVAGCAPYEGCGAVKPRVVTTPQTVTAPVLVEQAVPMYTYRKTQTLTMQPSCPCAEVQPGFCTMPDPCREVQHPRIKEVVVEKPRRACPLDGQSVNCRNGNFKTFQQPAVFQQTDVVMPDPSQVANQPGFYIADTTVSRQVVPDMPDAYILASNRVVSRLFKDMSTVYTKKPHISLYVKPAKALSDDLPGGIDKGTDNIKKQIANSYTFEIVDSPKTADYYIVTTADWFDTPSKSVPAIAYKAVLYDSRDNKVKEWVEIIKKADNSQSWL